MRELNGIQYLRALAALSVLGFHLSEQFGGSFKLRAAGVVVTIADYPSLVHCFVYLQTVLPEANAAMAAAAKAVRAALDAA